MRGEVSMAHDMAVETNALGKTYPNGVRALDRIDLNVPKGSLVGLLGPNGSGKTTTVKILCGLIRSFEGRARLEGIDLPSRATAGLLGYMPQLNALYSELSVYENLDFFGSINGLRQGPERRRRIGEVLELLGLAEKRRATVESLSGGMRQRVSLGCALIHSPRVILLDEPTVGLDPGLRLAFWSHFKELAASGHTIIICTHAFDEAKHCSHLAFLKSGRLLRFGRTEELRSEAGVMDWEAFYMEQMAGPAYPDGKPAAGGRI